MCTAKLCVWITDFGHSCRIIDQDTWFVHIVDCEGNVLKWCGREYRNIEAKCGHVEIDVPPGCYSVFASHTGNTTGTSFGNRLSHVQIVRVNCGDEACVTLFTPTLWFCGTWFATAVQMNIPRLAKAGVDREVANNAVKAVQRLLDGIPIDPFTANLQAFQREPGKKGLK